MPKAVLVKSGRDVEVMFQDEDVDVYVFDIKSEDLYLYKGNLVCRVLSVSDEGLLSLKCVDTLDGSITNRSFLNVDPSEVDFYESDSVDYED